MFVRIKTYGPRSYLCIVENFREGKKVKQRTIATLGRYEDLHQSGKLDALIESLAKFSKNIVVGLKNGMLSCF